MAIKIANALLAIIGGIGGAMLLYWLLNKLAESLPGRWEDRVKPWMFAGPAILAIAVYLIYPAVVTFQYSFANEDSTAYVGFRTTSTCLTDPRSSRCSSTTCSGSSSCRRQPWCSASG